MAAVTRSLPRYIRLAGHAILLLLFALACIVGRTSIQLVLLLALVLILTPSIRAAFRDRRRNPIDTMLVVAGVLPALSFLFTSEEPRDLLYAFNFLPLLVAVPVRWQLDRIGFSNGTSYVAWLSLAGAAIAALVAVAQVVVLGMERAGQPLMSAFQFADTAVLLGFFALAGLFVPGGRWRYLLLLGPVLGLTAAIVGGTRGAVLAAPVLGLLAIGFGYAKARDRRLLTVFVGAGLVAAIILILLAEQLGFGRATEGFEVAWRALLGQDVDNNVDERLVMYWGGLQAFLAAPVFGHGWPDMVEAIMPFLSPADAERMTVFRHLHNGLLSFAVGAGIPGIISFLILSVAPVVAVLRTGRDGQFAGRLYLAATLCAGYAVFQLTILMLGFEFHTVQYAFMAVAITTLAAPKNDGLSAG